MSGGSVTVHGGADGITARTEDLISTACLLRATASRLDDVHRQCDAALRLALSSDPDRQLDLADVIAQTRAATDGIADAAGRLRALAGRLEHAARSYLFADFRGFSLFGDIAALVGSVARFDTAAASGVAALARGDPVAALNALLTGDPDTVGDLVNVLGPHVIAAAVLALPDGRAAVTDLGVDRRLRETLPPRSLANLMDDLQLRNTARPGAIDVKILTGADGGRHVIVDITGTKSWSPAPHNKNVAGPATNVRALIGLPTVYESGVLTAMRRAGVRPDDPVMIVGHSLGGMVAVEAARDAMHNGLFRITHVITAGSPIGLTVGQLPPSVQVLALENRHDVVPHADGRGNPGRRNVLTVTVDRGDATVGGDHGIDSAYLPGARDAQASGAPSVSAFLAGADGYFTATEVETHAFVISRTFR